MASATPDLNYAGCMPEK